VSRGRCCGASRAAAPKPATHPVAARMSLEGRSDRPESGRSRQTAGPLSASSRGERPLCPRASINVTAASSAHTLPKSIRPIRLSHRRSDCRASWLLMKSRSSVIAAKSARALSACSHSAGWLARDDKNPDPIFRQRPLCGRTVIQALGYISACRSSARPRPCCGFRGSGRKDGASATRAVGCGGGGATICMARAPR
jgi:hypothetical protein